MSPSMTRGTDASYLALSGQDRERIYDVRRRGAAHLRERREGRRYGGQRTEIEDDIGRSRNGIDSRVESRGRRYTTTIPAGAAGNDAPLVSTSEIWTALAVGLNGLLVRDVRDDPRSGKTTKELTNLSQSDPDPATFQPPDGYEIVTKESSGCQGENTLGIATSQPAGRRFDQHPRPHRRSEAGAYWLENDARPLLPAILLF